MAEIEPEEVEAYIDLSPSSMEGGWLHRTRRLVTAMASLALSFAALNLVDGSETSLDAGRPDGPYAAHPFVYEGAYIVKPVTIPARAVSGIEISDTFDGVLSTRGYNLIIRTNKLVDSLGKRDVAVVTQTSTIDAWGAEYDTKYIDRAIFFSPETEARRDFHDPAFLTDEQKEKWRQLMSWRESSIPGISSARYAKGSKLPKGTIDLGDGVEAHSSAANVRVQVLRFASDGSVTTKNDETASISFTDNVPCEDDRPTVVTSTEVKLTSKQHAVVCKMLRDYGALLADDYRVTLDVTANEFEAHDSQSKNSRSVQLTYPYEEGKEVSETGLRQVALHEILHAAYATVAEGSRPFNEASRAYRQMRLAMEYKLPDLTQRMNSGLSVGRAEPVWGAITESTYIGLRSTNGHPWDSPTEMLSSVAAVMAFYPDQLLQNYAKLSLRQQDAVYHASHAAADLIEYYGVSVDSIIPRYSELDARMQQLMHA